MSDMHAIQYIKEFNYIKRVVIIEEELELSCKIANRASGDTEENSGG
jgi:hypothetical protein